MSTVFVGEAHPPQGDPDNMFTVKNPVPGEKAAGPVDVVVLGHLGLDGFEYVRDLWGGGLVGSTVHVKFWRHAAASVPVDDVALARWIYQRWVELDEWVDAKRNPGAAEDLSPRGARVSQT